jgi:hypothetical protein
MYSFVENMIERMLGAWGLNERGRMSIEDKKIGKNDQVSRGTKS